MEPVYWLAIAFVLAGAILVVLVVRYFYRAARGTRVKGVVHKTTGRVSHGGPRRDRRVHYTAYIEYQFNDCEYLMELPLGTGVFPYYPGGSKLTVVVDEAHPEKGLVFSFQAVLMWVAAMVLAAALIALGSTILVVGMNV